MSCKKVIRQLPAYLDRELSQREVTELERHLEVCVFCSAELSALRATAKMLDAWEGISPRRSYSHSVINRIRAEEEGISETRGIGTRLWQRRCTSATLRAAAAIVFVVGAGLFAGHVPVEKARDEVASVGAGYLRPEKTPLLFDEDLIRSHIRPSEWGLVPGRMGNRGLFVEVSSGRWRMLPGRGDDPSLERGGFREVNHIYFPDEGMPVESVIPLDLPQE
jgi:hypothetical protein